MEIADQHKLNAMLQKKRTSLDRLIGSLRQQDFKSADFLVNFDSGINIEISKLLGVPKEYFDNAESAKPKVKNAEEETNETPN